MELKDMTFLQVLQLSVFKEELSKQLQLELEAYKDANKRGKLKRMAMDRLIEKGMFNEQAMTTAYYHIMHKEADRDEIPSNERQYITDVCTLAYTRTIRILQAESRYNEQHPFKAKLIEWWEKVKAFFKRNSKES